MIRILFDECEDAQSDLFLKVDTTPTFVQVADSYFLNDFLIKEYETKIEMLLGYIEYIKEGFLNSYEKESFMAFDLSDQYLGGLFLSKGIKGLIKIEYGWSREIEGWGINQETIESQVKEKRKDFKIERDWLISKDTMMEGVNWSIEKIKKLPTTTTPDT